MTEVECLACGESTDLARSCANCDYPLFWTAEDLVAVSTTDPFHRSPSAPKLADHVRRQAGVAGIKRRFTVACQNCNELNLAVEERRLRAEARCHRCAELVYEVPPEEPDNRAKTAVVPVTAQAARSSTRVVEEDQTWILLAAIAAIGLVLSILGMAIALI